MQIFNNAIDMLHKKLRFVDGIVERNRCAQASFEMMLVEPAVHAMRS